MSICRAPNLAPSDQGGLVELFRTAYLPFNNTGIVFNQQQHLPLRQGRCSSPPSVWSRLVQKASWLGFFGICRIRCVFLPPSNCPYDYYTGCHKGRGQEMILNVSNFFKISNFQSWQHFCEVDPFLGWCCFENKCKCFWKTTWQYVTEATKYKRSFIQSFLVEFIMRR